MDEENNTVSGSSATTSESGREVAPTEQRLIVCEVCSGDGWFCDDRPTPTPQGPHYGPDVQCITCDGKGEYEVEFSLITEEDVWEAFQ